MAGAAQAVAASPIAELEQLLMREQAAPARPADGRIHPAATVARQRDGLPWNYAVLERDPHLRRAAIDPLSPVAPHPPAVVDNSELKGSVGCLVGGTLGATVASIAGGTNTINLIGGGVVSAINPITFYVSMVGVVFISFCQLGQALTPLYVYMTTPSAEPTIGTPELAPRQPLDDLPDFRRGVPYESRPGVPMVRAADQPGGWQTDAPVQRGNCVRDRRSIRLAMAAMVHGEAVPPSCSGSLI